MEDLRLVQLMGGKAGVTGEEIKRRRKATENLRPTFLIVEFNSEPFCFCRANPDRLHVAIKFARRFTSMNVVRSGYPAIILRTMSPRSCVLRLKLETST